MEIEGHGELHFCGQGFGLSDFIISSDSSLGRTYSGVEGELVFPFPCYCPVTYLLRMVTQEAVFSLSQAKRKKTD